MIKTIKTGEPITWNPKNYLYGYSNSFNGTFSHGGLPISIMINQGKVIRANACHYEWSYPESVLWIKSDGSHGVSRVITYNKIPGYKDIVFAIGGVGISDFNPKAEGFCTFTRKNVFNGKEETKKFGDVLRRTNHSVFGFKGDKFFASVMYGHASEIKAECEKQGFTDVIMGDGGKFAAYNTDEQFNVWFKQYSAVQLKNSKNLDLVEEKKWRYFRYSEFANTKAGGKNETSYDLIDKLDELRHLVGRPIHITSGYRTPAFNKSVGGSPNSEHIYGLAADLRFDFRGYTKESIVRICKYLGFKNVGFYWKYGRIGGTLDRLHLGIDDRSNGKLRVMDWHSSNGKLYATTYV